MADKRANRIAIVGGGPGGLSLARMLKEHGVSGVKVFEADTRVGGKSWTYSGAGAICEMGTCYATRSDQIVKRWMKAYGIKLKGLGATEVDGRPLMDYVRPAPGPSLPVQMMRYISAYRSLNKRMAARTPDAATLKEAATPISDWLAERKLFKIERMHHRALTSLGYGFVDETPAIQAVRWMDLQVILSGVLAQLYMPDCGWEPFWTRVAEELDVVTGARVTAVRRDAGGVEIETVDGAKRFDHVVCAMPVDDFAALTEPTEDEIAVNAGVVWNRYATTLVASKDWYTSCQVRAYTPNARPGAEPGGLFSARLDDESEELGGRLYILNQYPGDLTAEELRETAVDQVCRDGGTVENVVLQKLWKFFPRYRGEAIEAGLLQRMRDMQGRARTWYTGATFSHEAVSHITRFNAGLSERMRGALNGVEPVP